jgi:hypothetical protein
MAWKKGNQYVLVEGLEPAKTPRRRHGPVPKCVCDSPTCIYCRNKASQRRWYQRNKDRVIKKTSAYLKVMGPVFRARKKMRDEKISDEDLDRRCLDMLRQEGLR